VDDWSQGVPLAYVQEVCAYWAEGYDWRAAEARINARPQFRTRIDGVDVHFLHVRSTHAHARPLILTHGWPGSIVEFLNVIDPLTQDAEHPFHLVVPSMPGYGFSGRPAETGWGVERIADAWVVLMERLGYERFAAQGGDWGTSVTASLGRRHPERMLGLHLVPPLVPIMRDDLTEQEEAALNDMRRFGRREAGYSTEQRTKPQTIGYALTDSPAALCAWIVEKFHGWTDCDGHPENAVARDEILDNLMLYWLPATGASAARLYWESLDKVDGWLTGRIEPQVVEVPVGCSIFPRELQRPSRRWTEPYFTDIRHWGEPERGGHFAALEQPEAFVREVRAAFAHLR